MAENTGKTRCFTGLGIPDAGYPQMFPYPFAGHVGRLLLGILLSLTAISTGHAASPDSETESAPPNVLLIMVDDLRPDLGCYGDQRVQTPHIDALAKQGLLFNRAYCQQAVCNPSRTSLMLGLRPDSTGVVGNHKHFREQHPDIVTLPQQFRAHGYRAEAIGKIYHGPFPDGTSKTVWDTMGDPPSWSAPATRFGPRYYYSESGIRQARQAYQEMYKPQSPGPDDWQEKLVFGPMTESPEVDDDVLFDGKVASTAVDSLRRLSKTPDQPFFLAVGFIKPHTPFVAPKKYFDLYDPATLSVADNPSLPTDSPRFAGHNSGEVRRYTDQPKRGEFSVENQLRLRLAYLACTSFVDAQIGRVLKELDALSLDDNTIIVLVSDHGWHLGEHGLWGKTTNFELDTHVPLIVKAPGQAVTGQSTDALVELVDIYPTLCELAGLPLPKELEGTSFQSLLSEPEQPWKSAAFSQYPRQGNLMGYTMRTTRYRYTEWIDQSTGDIRARELYDHADDPNETVSIAEVAANANLVSTLSVQLAGGRGWEKIKQSRVRVACVGDSITFGYGIEGRNTNSYPARLQQKLSSSYVVENFDRSVAKQQVDSFESPQAGALAKYDGPLGEWRSEPGHAEIYRDHRRTGNQSLHIAGGKDRTIELKLSESVDRGLLTFWAERWTRRDPFEFVIEQSIAGEWHEIYRGDNEIRIGGFLTRVQVPLLPSGDGRVRLRCTSPPDSGLLIDDVAIEPPQPFKIESVASLQPTLPLLVGTKSTPVSGAVVDVVGNAGESPSLKSITIAINGTLPLDQIERVDVVYSAAEATVRNLGTSDANGPKRFATSDTPGKKLELTGSQDLTSGKTHFWVAVTLRDSANIDHRLTATINRLEFADGSTFDLAEDKPVSQRLGVALRQHGDDGVHTFRIPGLATTNTGTLIAVYDIRHRNGGDLPGDIDVGMSRSTDGGRTWEPMRAIIDAGDDPRWRYDGVGDPAVLVDRETGTIWVAALWSHGNRGWVGSQPGLEPTDTGQLLLVRSDDDGKTWSAPINITEQVKKPELSLLLQGPGRGITLRDGTLVFAAQYQEPPAKQRLPHSTILYSRDHGDTWQVGTGAADDTTEAQVVELPDGRLMLNCRYNRQPRRVVMVTDDLGQTWQEHPSSRDLLIEPRSCMASLISVPCRNGENPWLLFSNPNDTTLRRRMTIKASADLGMSWPEGKQLLLDEFPSAGYSCMTVIDDKTIGILYEGSQAHLTFQRVPLEDVIDNKSDTSTSTD